MIRLESEGLEPLELMDPDAGIVVTAFDLGWPTTRAVVNGRPHMDGSDDQTAYVGPRVVSLEVSAWDGTAGSSGRMVDRLARFCYPGRRSVMVFADEGTDGMARRVLIRADQGSAPKGPDGVATIAVQWIGYTGIVEAADEATATVTPAPGPTGAPWDWEWPVAWPAYAPPSTDVISAGSMPAWPTITIHGPCTSPRVRCGDAVLSFPDLEVVDGDTITIDSAARTVVLNGRIDRRSRLDFSRSTWWQIAPGPNPLGFSAAAWSPPARAVVAWRNAYFL